MMPARNLIALALLTLMWGVNWPVMKLGLRELSPLYFRALTMTGGFLLLLLWYRLRGHTLRLPAGMLGRVALLAAPNILGWHAMSIFGVQALASGRAAIIGFTMPIWTVLIGVFFFREKMTPRLWLATACAAAAVLLLLWHELATMSGRPAGMAWMLGAAISWALGTLLLKRLGAPVPTEALTVWMIGLSVPMFWLLAFSLEPLPTWQFSPSMWGVLAYSAAINYGVAQIIWFSIARSLPPTASALSIMFIPVIGLGSAMQLAGEMPYGADYVAVALIIAALATTLLPARQRGVGKVQNPPQRR
ncbi:MAG: EamA family transporter [Zoogloeaceae bacterium]|nr:EamA family transporter [Zoogloeaceae bacterium]